MPPVLPQTSALVFDVIGVLGFAIYVTTYALLTFQKITSHSPRYFALNLTAATFVLVGLTQSFNLASAMIQMFWIVMSITAIAMRLKGARAGSISGQTTGQTRLT